MEVLGEDLFNLSKGRIEFSELGFIIEFEGCVEKCFKE